MKGQHLRDLNTGLFGICNKQQSEKQSESGNWQLFALALE